MKYDIQVVSVHFNVPLLTLIQAISLTKQEDVNYHFTVIDSYPEEIPELTQFYDKLQKDGLIHKAVPIRVGGHGKALNFFFRYHNCFWSRRMLIMDSDSFTTSPDTLKVVCKEIDEQGATGIYRAHGRQWGDPFDISFFGVEVERVFRAIDDTEKGFMSHNFSIEDIRSPHRKRDIHDAGDDICWHCMGKKKIPETKAKFEHIRALTIFKNERKFIPPRRLQKIHQITQDLGVYNLFKEYGINLPPNQECWNPDNHSESRFFEMEFEPV